jgi:hypothetical protein
MKHIDDAGIVALRDDDTADASAYAHLEECATCVVEVADARTRSTRIAGALASLDGPIDVAAAKAATRARLDQARTRRAAPAWRRWPLGRAAILVLASAGAVSALTWTPLRSLWAPARTAPEPAPATVALPATAEGLAREPTTSGIAVPVPDGRIEVIVRGMTPGSVLEVAWIGEAAARVVAPTGSDFTYADGRIEVDAAAGGLRIELPRAASAASLDVDGRPYVERSAAGVVVHVPVVERTDDVIRFVTPAP